MAYETLQRILDEEGQSFQVIQNNWRPTNLLADYQTKLLLSNVVSRVARIGAAQDEFKKMDRAALYTRLWKRMVLRVREAIYSRRFNHLAFLLSVARFYEDYGTFLRYLKIDQSRGKLDVQNHSESEQSPK